MFFVSISVANLAVFALFLNADKKRKRIVCGREKPRSKWVQIIRFLLLILQSVLGQKALQKQQKNHRKTASFCTRISPFFKGKNRRILPLITTNPFAARCGPSSLLQGTLEAPREGRKKGGKLLGRKVQKRGDGAALGTFRRADKSAAQRDALTRLCMGATPVQLAPFGALFARTFINFQLIFC